MDVKDFFFNIEDIANPIITLEEMKDIMGIFNNSMNRYIETCLKASQLLLENHCQKLLSKRKITFFLRNYNPQSEIQLPIGNLDPFAPVNQQILKIMSENGEEISIENVKILGKRSIHIENEHINSDKFIITYNLLSADCNDLQKAIIISNARKMINGESLSELNFDFIL